jgi:hypothetical protein
MLREEGAAPGWIIPVGINMMNRFEYEITKHSASEFVELAYFCTDSGECTLSELPAHQMDSLNAVLNERGEEGWELVQVFFGNAGMVAFWKRPK